MFFECSRNQKVKRRFKITRSPFFYKIDIFWKNKPLKIPGVNAEQAAYNLDRLEIVEKKIETLTQLVEAPIGCGVAGGHARIGNYLHEDKLIPKTFRQFGVEATSVNFKQIKKRIFNAEKRFFSTENE